MIKTVLMDAALEPMALLRKFAASLDTPTVRSMIAKMNKTNTRISNHIMMKMKGANLFSARSLKGNLKLSLRYSYLPLWSLLLTYSCTVNYHQNNLKNSPSLYLRQHAENPVHWQNWSDEVLEHAQRENKLLLISIGYSSCHWCHVMEEESFEDEQVAQLMNDRYVSIKIDREERPDLDARYMNAVQLMTGQGGWPLNFVALPDGTPVWGGKPTTSSSSHTPSPSASLMHSSAQS